LPKTHEESNWGTKQIEPVEPNPISLIREQQHAALILPAVSMICSVDLGNGSPHYPNKKAVGERLAGLALRHNYHQPGRVDSPRYKSFDVEGNRIRLKFTDAYGLRVRDGANLRGLAVRGTEGNWVWASGRIDGPEIIVWSDQVPAPIAVRYAWAVNPITSIENGAGLPLCPFRTDLQSNN
jgi:sialate O-acetylesterase